jgi:hypothetical protein
MTTDVQAATDLYGQLKPQARQQARDFILSRTPANLQDEMLAVFQADMADIADQLQVPVVVDAPFISQAGTGIGSTLTSTLGNWEGAPTSRTYQWKNAGVNIGTNSPSYTVISTDLGDPFTCTMVATNTAGASAPVVSNTITVA